MATFRSSLPRLFAASDIVVFREREGGREGGSMVRGQKGRECK